MKKITRNWPHFRISSTGGGGGKRELFHSTSTGKIKEAGSSNIREELGLSLDRDRDSPVAFLKPSTANSKAVPSNRSRPLRPQFLQDHRKWMSSHIVPRHITSEDDTAPLNNHQYSHVTMHLKINLQLKCCTWCSVHPCLNRMRGDLLKPTPMRFPPPPPPKFVYYRS
jgi:hypothetical protein